ncbi:MAG: hypothetical protein ACREH3_12070, partial [Geminicoccales bacterium]
LEVTTPERWCEWCNDRGIELQLGPFLQAVKNVKLLAGLPFDFERARARYSGEDKEQIRKAGAIPTLEFCTRPRTGIWVCEV